MIAHQVRPHPRRTPRGKLTSVKPHVRGWVVVADNLYSGERIRLTPVIQSRGLAFAERDNLALSGFSAKVIRA